MHILVAGATGFIGRALCERLVDAEHTVVALTRDTEAARRSLRKEVRVVAWEPPTPGAWCDELADVDAIVNLVGEVLVGRWTTAKKAEIRRSRIDCTNALVEALGATPQVRSATLPTGCGVVFLQGSAVGYYGNGSEEVDESSPPGTDFLAQLCKDWEDEALRAERMGARVVLVRTGVVLGPGGGALAKMLTPFRLGLGGPIGTGQQWMPWIALDDVVGIFEHALQTTISGPVNGVAPEATVNKVFAETLASLLGRSAWLPIPAAVVRAMFGEGGSVLLGGQRVTPKKLVDSGFVFRYPTLKGALQQALGEVSR